MLVSSVGPIITTNRAKYDGAGCVVRAGRWLIVTPTFSHVPDNETALVER